MMGEGYASAGGNFAFAPLLRQNGSFYRLAAVDQVSVAGAVSTGVQHPIGFILAGSAGLTPADFVRIGDAGDGGPNPDFSCAGSKIEFGFYTGNSHRNSDARESKSGIDDWAMTVHAKSCEACVECPPGNTGWYPFDGDGDDISASNADAAGTDIAYGDGKVGEAATLAGPASVFTIMPASAHDYGTSDFSIDAWINVPEAWFSEKGLHTIVDKRAGPPDAPTGYALYLWNNGSGLVLGLQLAEGAAGYTNFNDTVAISGPGWVHIAVTVDRDQSLFFYVDGVAHPLIDPSSRDGNLGNAAPTLVGQNAFDHGVPSTGLAIDELEFFNRALDGAEVVGIFDAGSAGKCKPEEPLTIFKVYTHPPDGTYADGATFPITVDCVNPDDASQVMTFTGSITSSHDGSSANSWTIDEAPMGWICTPSETQPTTVDTLPNGVTCSWKPESYISPVPVTIGDGVNGIGIKNNYSCSVDPAFDLDLFNATWLATDGGGGPGADPPCGNGQSYITLQNMSNSTTVDTTTPIVVEDSKPAGSTVCGYGPTTPADWSCTPAPGNAGPASCAYVGGATLAPYDSLPPLQIFWAVVPGASYADDLNCAEMTSPPDDYAGNNRYCTGLDW
jgi:hypothetical protein